MSTILRTQHLGGHRIDDLSNGNVLVDGVTELVPPSDWVKPDTTWTMFDAEGNLIVGCLLDDHEPTLILRDPTRAEARAKIGAEMAKWQRAGHGAHVALKKALKEWPMHARIYCAS